MKKWDNSILEDASVNTLYKAHLTHLPLHLSREFIQTLKEKWWFDVILSVNITNGKNILTQNMERDSGDIVRCYKTPCVKCI